MNRSSLEGNLCLHFSSFLGKNAKFSRFLWSKSNCELKLFQHQTNSKVYFLSKQSNISFFEYLIEAFVSSSLLSCISANTFWLLNICRFQLFSNQCLRHFCSTPKSLFITVQSKAFNRRTGWLIDCIQLVGVSLESAWNNENCPLDTQKWLKLNLLPLLRQSTLTVRS